MHVFLERVGVSRGVEVSQVVYGFMVTLPPSLLTYGQLGFILFLFGFFLEWGRDIKEIVWNHVENVSQLLQKDMEPYGLNVLNYALRGDHRFPRKFVMLNFKCYSRATDPIHHLRQYQDKMAVHSHDNLLLSPVFSSKSQGCRLRLVPFAPETISGILGKWSKLSTTNTLPDVSWGRKTITSLPLRWSPKSFK